MPTRQQFIKKGHGKIAPWLDLVNSEEWDTYGRPIDWMRDPSWLPFFLKQWHFSPPPYRPFPLEKFMTLRVALRASSEALVAGEEIPGSALGSLNNALNVPGRYQLHEDPNGLQVGFVPISSGWDWILGQTALSFVLLLHQGGAERVKICKNPDCHWIFCDSTKAKTRVWCSGKSCGNRDRVRRARARASR